MRSQIICRLKRVRSTYELMKAFKSCTVSCGMLWWEIYFCKDTQRQANAFDCGLHVMRNMHGDLQPPEWDNNSIIHAEENDPSKGRLHLASVLLRNHSNVMKESLESRAREYGLSRDVGVWVQIVFIWCRTCFVGLNILQPHAYVLFTMFAADVRFVAVVAIFDYLIINWICTLYRMCLS